MRRIPHKRGTNFYPTQRPSCLEISTWRTWMSKNQKRKRCCQSQNAFLSENCHRNHSTRWSAPFTLANPQLPTHILELSVNGSHNSLKCLAIWRAISKMAERLWLTCLTDRLVPLRTGRRTYLRSSFVMASRSCGRPHILGNVGTS
jgi:hypothetical protein